MTALAQIHFELPRLASPVPAGSPAPMQFTGEGSRPALVVPVAARAPAQILDIVREAGSRRQLAVVQRPVPTRLLSVHGVRRLRTAVDQQSTTDARHAVGELVQDFGETFQGGDCERA